MTQEDTKKPKKVEFKGTPHIVPSASLEREDDTL